MRLPTTLAGLLYLIIAQAPYVTSSPLIPKNELQNDLDWIKHLFDRQAPCAGTYCGLSTQYCCTGGSTCYTDAQTIARCGAPTAAAVVGGWQYFTTTIVMTDFVTVVSTYSSLVVAATTQNFVQSTAICNSNQGSCGAICCDNSYEYCYATGKCTPYGAAGSTTLASAPLRPTSGTATTVTAVVSPTTTQTFQTPVSTGGSTSNGTAIVLASSGGGLSGGAIAGIVIGVLAGITILIAVCFCCILRAGVDGILDLFGLRNRSRERTEVIEERYSRHGSASSRRDTHGGGRTARTEKKRSGISEGGIFLSILAGLGALWAILGLRRRSREKAARSEVSYETNSGSYSGTSESESSKNPYS